jgi:hypothetical protein
MGMEGGGGERGEQGLGGVELPGEKGAMDQDVPRAGANQGIEGPWPMQKLGGKTGGVECGGEERGGNHECSVMRFMCGRFRPLDLSRSLRVSLAPSLPPSLPLSLPPSLPPSLPEARRPSPAEALGFDARRRSVKPPGMARDRKGGKKGGRNGGRATSRKQVPLACTGDPQAFQPAGLNVMNT